MEDRFDRVDQVGSALVRNAFRFLTDRVSLPATDDVPLFVVNPNTRAFRGTMRATLAFPIWENRDAFSIRDERGEVVPHEEIARSTTVDMEVNRPRPTQLVDVALALTEIPPCGYRTLYVGPPTDQKAVGPRLSGTTLQNEFLHVSVDSRGAIEIEDQDTGRTYSGLHLIEDTADAGDEYTYSPAPEGKTLTNADARVEVEPLSADLYGRVSASVTTLTFPPVWLRTGSTARRKRWTTRSTRRSGSGLASGGSTS
jgi:hypothetical protein